MRHARAVTTVLTLISLMALIGCNANPKSTKAGTAELCPCGMPQGSDDCCNDDLPKCPDCGKIKGSPACCK
ncbi:MAG: hypothetical protein QGH76_00955 [Phycisphaerales bacterium]|jgi:hypothetical protein|nr:hypothetical protein [Phycisphaerales bacterium]